MKKLKLVSVILSFFLIINCSTTSKKENTISISGAFALYPLVVKWSEEYKKENPEIRFNISAGGAGKGMADALSGTIDLGMFSREITQEEKDKGVWWVGLTIDAVLPTISAENPFIDSIKKRGVTQNEFRSIFIEESIKNWSDLINIKENKDIVIYTRSDACGAAGTWAKYLGGVQEDISGIGIYGDPGLAETVIKDPYAIGFNNTIYVYDINSGQKRPGIEIVPIDINKNGKIDIEENFYDSFNKIQTAIAKGTYPSPPARELYFVSKGKPKKQIVLDFIKWSLTEGQKYIKESGYVTLEPNKIETYLNTVKN